MLPFLSEHFGNPSGAHAVARRARRAVDEARDTVALHVGCEPGEVVFTAGGTEACNLAVLGAHRATGGEVLCSAFEHHAVLDASTACGGRLVPVTAEGLVDLEALEAALHPGVAVVSVMAVNNEVGTVQPLGDVVRLVRRRAPGALVHSDAVAAGAWLDLAEVAGQVDLLSIGAHKFGGPKGTGALVVRHRAPLAPVLYGGSQERDRRPGTHDVAGIVGMAAALEASAARRAEESARLGALTEQLARGLCEAVPGARRTAAGTPRTAGHCHLLFDGVDQEELLVLLDEGGVCASAGSACASGALEPSHVLLAMGMSPTVARQAVRFSLGWSTTAADVKLALGVVAKAVERLRSS